MIAHAAPSSHVRLKRLYERPSPQDDAGVLLDQLSWRSCAKQILPSIAKRHRSEQETGGFRSSSRAGT